MSVVAKILIVINLLLAVAFLAASATFLGAKTHWKHEYEVQTAKLKEDIKELNSTKAQLQTNLAEQERIAEREEAKAKEKDNLIKKLQDNYDQVDQAHQLLSSAHGHLTAAYEQLEKDYKAKVDDVSAMRDQLDTAVNEKEDAVRRENAAVAEKQRVGDQLLEAQQKIAAMAKDQTAMAEEIDNLKLENEAFKREVGPLAGVLTPPSMDAMVTGVSDKVNLVILSVGRDDKVMKGFEFTIFRGSEFVGKVVVDRVEKDHCTAFSRKEVERTPIKVGDKGTTRF
jgi:SMC interacting uncharacterized protein involved in chromosome segregation